MHGVVHERAGLLSRRAVAPEGLVIIMTCCGDPVGAGRRGARWVSGRAGSRTGASAGAGPRGLGLVSAGGVSWAAGAPGGVVCGAGAGDCAAAWVGGCCV